MEPPGRAALAGPAGLLAVPLIPAVIGWLVANWTITVTAFTIATTIVSGTASCSRPTRTLVTHAITATPRLTGLATATASSRAILFYGAANRDERKFPNPDSFDVTRSSADQVAFGWGPHVCVGQHLAKLEMAAIFRALATRVNRFHIEEEIRNVHNVLRGFSKLIISVE